MRNKERMLTRLVGKVFEIDDEGRIWRIAKFSKGGRLHPIEQRRADCRCKRSGYLFVSSVINGRQVTCPAHRLVYQYFYGNIPEGLVINHINGIKTDNYPKNLEAITVAENSERVIRDVRRWWSPYSLRVENRTIRF